VEELSTAVLQPFASSCGKWIDFDGAVFACVDVGLQTFGHGR